jgi:hypothetical protein
MFMRDKELICLQQQSVFSPLKLVSLKGGVNQNVQWRSCTGYDNAYYILCAILKIVIVCMP